MPESAHALRAEVRAFLRAELDAGAFVPRCDSWLSGFDRDFSRRLAQRGWIGMTWPPAYGGHGRTAMERFVVVEELLAAGAPVAAHWVADRQTGPALMKYGTEEQRRMLLPRIARGECSFAIGMSEPDSGSDLSAVRTAAVRVEGGWRLRGSKIWSSHAHRCDDAVVLARTRPGAQRHEGLSQLIVDLRSPGVTVRPIRHMSGEAHFSEMVFDDVLVPDSMLLGREGEGWTQVVAELGFERSGPERLLSTHPLLVSLVSAGGAADDRTAEAVGMAYAQIVALRRMSLGVAAALAEGRDPSVDAAVVKDLGTQLESALIESVRRVAPGDDPALQAMLAAARLSAPNFTLRGGTSEILRGIVARAVGLR